MKTLLVGLRTDTPLLALELSKRFRLVPFPASGKPPVQDFHVPSLPVMGVDVSQFVAENWNTVATAVAVTNRLIDEHKPAGCVLWNTVTPQHAGVALACRSRGVPVFEITHWAIATYLIGHFEDLSLADLVFCSQEHANFAQRSGRDMAQYRVLGRPQYEHWKQEDRYAMRNVLGIEENGPYILVTSTWSHYFTNWSGPDWNLFHQSDMIQMLQYFQAANPDVKILWTTRFPGQGEGMANRLGQAGLAVHVTDDTDVQDLINAADIVLCQKSGIIADCAVLGRPVVVADYRPNADAWAWKDSGAFHARDMRRMVNITARLLRNPKLVEAVTARQATWREHFGAVPGCSARIAEEIERYVS